MLTFLVIAAFLLLIAFGVAGWQITTEDREDRRAAGTRIAEMMRREDLHILASGRKDGVVTVLVGSRADDQVIS